MRIAQLGIDNIGHRLNTRNIRMPPISCIFRQASDADLPAGCRCRQVNTIAPLIPGIGNAVRFIGAVFNVGTAIGRNVDCERNSVTILPAAVAEFINAIREFKP